MEYSPNFPLGWNFLVTVEFGLDDGDIVRVPDLSEATLNRKQCPAVIWVQFKKFCELHLARTVGLVAHKISNPLHEIRLYYESSENMVGPHPGSDLLHSE